MDKIKLIGIVTKITDLFEKGNFKKRSVILRTEGEHSQVFEVEFPNKKEELLDMVSEGQRVEVSVNLRGREWINPQGEAKYFTSLSGWKIEDK